MYGSQELLEQAVDEESTVQSEPEASVDPFLLKQRDAGRHAVKRALGYFGSPERVDQRQPIAFYVGRSNAT